MTEKAVAFFSALPPPMLFWGGLILFLTGAGAFISELRVKKRAPVNHFIVGGFCLALVGLAMLLFPLYPKIAVVLMFIFVLIILWPVFGIWTVLFWS